MVEPISRFMISLLAGDGVADFCRSGAGELAHGGRLVHFGDGEVGILHIERPAAPATGASTRAEDAGAGARLFAVSLDAGEDLGRGRVDHARRHGADGGGFGRFDAAESEAVERAGGGAATD